MSSEPFASLFAVTLFCSDLNRSEDFYTKFLEAQPVFRTDNSMVFQIGQLMVNLLDKADAPELIEPEAVSESGQNALYTVQVRDLGPQIARLAGHGLVLLNGPMVRPWGIRALTLQDPDGHIWEVSQPLN